MVDLEMLCRYANSDDDLPPEITRDVIAEIGELRFENERLTAKLAAAQARVKRLEEATLRLMHTQMQPSWTDEDEYDHELKEALANCRAALAEKP